jgi:hypothetical protein
MNISPDAESNGNPEFPGHEQFDDYLLDIAERPGIVTALCDQLDATAQRWHEYAEDDGHITLGNFEGDSVTISRIEWNNGQRIINPQPEQTAARGLGKWLKKWRYDDSSLHYVVSFADGDTEVTLTAIKLANGTIDLKGTQKLETAQGPQVAKLRSGVNLEEAIERASHIIETGFPMSAEAAIAERQNQPCSEIIGNEAIGVQKALENIIIPNRATELGDKTAPERTTVYDVIGARDDERWTVNGLNIVERRGTVIPYTEGLVGRSILSHVHFSDAIVGSAGNDASLVVRVEGVYENDTNKLLGASVNYSSRSQQAFGQGEALQVGPQDRQAIHAAIANQLTAGTVVQLHEFKSE